VLDWFVAREWLEESARAMLAWLHFGFGTRVGSRLVAGNRAGVLRVAHYAARVPVAESRLHHDAECAKVELFSDRRARSFAGTR
jgi:hypothetical protein